ncbi:uncharacterized protein G2W53_025781 [Senna tora]|uniref:Uncharacterized protein n=1 Tax=Senna tora TaxID=362788 RepID=A0A834WI87_9FABA|nr:uncharacterized protein G2W53_025781 [Senna tora]
MRAFGDACRSSANQNWTRGENQE